MADYPNTSWTDEERGQIQFALLYSPTPRTIITIGWDVSLDEDLIGLANRLPELTPAQKARALSMAEEIEAAERDIIDASKRSAGVTKVGEISRDQDKAIETLSSVAGRMRARLADYVSWRVNPAANTGKRTGGGGINATVSA